MRDGLESAFGGQPSSDSDRQTRRSMRTPGGLRFQVFRGVPEGDEAEVLGAAIDRMAAWDEDQEQGPWGSSIRPGVGLRAWRRGSRWGHSLRSRWGREP